MDLKSYFEQKQGLGILSTANKDGKVDAAVYASPYVYDDHTMAFIMADKLSHANLAENPYAHYLFKEHGDQYVGKRLSLKKIKESDDEALIDEVRRKIFNASISGSAKQEKFFLVSFEIQGELPLIGTQ